MASKRVRLPSAKLANESGVEDSFNDVDDEEATFATERTSGLISDVFETDQGKTTWKTFRKKNKHIQFDIRRNGDTSISFPIGTFLSIF